jgi:hypothetical protein
MEGTEGIRLLQNGATAEESAVLWVGGDYPPHALSQSDGDAIQTSGSKIGAHAQELKQHRQARFGLPCANCKAYYDSELPACPICNWAERVPVGEAEAKSANILKKPLAGVLQDALGSFVHLDSPPECGPPLQLAPHCEEDDEPFLLESRLLLYAHSDEIDARQTRLCVLDENHDTQSEYASICLSCYNRLRQKLARTEAALLMDLREASQIVYEAVWTDPAPADPSRTYQRAAQALLSELCQRAGVVRLPHAT